MAAVCPTLSLDLQVLLIIAVGFAFCFVYLPMLKRMNDALVRSKWLLSLFPDEVVFSVDALLTAMAAYTKSDRD